MISSSGSDDSSSNQRSSNSNSIRAIDGASIRKICSGQVVLDLPSAVKELVENALDANATVIEIKLKNHGIDCIEVSDNGDGIAPTDYAGVAMKHYTSKLHSFSDLSSVSSFGFRGEALNALCELSGNFSVLTKQRDQDVAASLSFQRDGRLEEVSPASRSTGTTVTVTDLFEVLPVRRSEFIRNAKKQYVKLLKLIQSYAVVSVGVKMSLILIEKNSRTAVIETRANSTMSDNIGLVFGVKFLNTLTPISFELDCVAVDDSKVQERLGRKSEAPDPRQSTSAAAADDGNNDEESDLDPVTVKASASVVGLVSKAGLGVGRSDNDRQFIFCNGRPVDLPRVSKVMNEVWRKYEMKQKPAFFLNIITPPGTFDVNMSPDKREIALTNEQVILDKLKETVDEIYAPSRGTFVQSQPKDLSQTLLSYSSIDRGGLYSQGSESTIDLTGESQRSTQSGRTTESSRVTPPPPRSSSKDSSRDNKNKLIDDESSGDTSDEAEFDEDEEVKRIAKIRTAELEASGVTEPSQLGNDSSKLQDKLAENDSDSAGDTNPIRNNSERSEKSGKLSGYNMPKAKPSVFLEEFKQSIPDFDLVSSEDEEQSLSDILEGESTSYQQIIMDDNEQIAEDGGDVIVISSSGSDEDDDDMESSNSEEDSSRTETSSKKRKATSGPDEGIEDVVMKKKVSGTVWNFDIETIKRDVEEKRIPVDPFRRPYHWLHLESTSQNVSNGSDGGTEVKAREGEEGVRVLKKEDFLSMRILGQFNLGFMIAEHGDDLYILDQHACDEKYNFETIQLNTTIHQQPLIAPVNLDLTCAEELVVVDHLDVFTANGFKIDADMDRAPGNRIRLVAVPYSKGIQFGVEDVRELASMIAGEFENYADVARADIEIRNEKLSGSSSSSPSTSQDNSSSSQSNSAVGARRSISRLRLPKLVSMFASRACRMSVMIGKALTINDMVGITRRLSTISQPWNCPHGRPTMRHLVDYKKLWTSRVRTMAEQSSSYK